MKAFEVFAIYVTPFLIIGAAIKLLMKRYAVDLPDPKARLQAKAQISARSLAYRRIGRAPDGSDSWRHHVIARHPATRCEPSAKGSFQKLWPFLGKSLRKMPSTRRAKGTRIHTSRSSSVVSGMAFGSWVTPAMRSPAQIVLPPIGPAEHLPIPASEIRIGYTLRCAA